MSKQTAVEQLIHEMESLLEQPYVNPKNALNDCINLAYNKLQMEKKQIEDAYDMGYLDYQNLTHDSSKEYFNKTYGGEQ
jgi:hypothetical protein